MLKVINNHLDRLDSLEERFDDDLDKIIKSIDLKSIINNPSEELKRVAEDIKELLEEKYYKDALTSGKKFAEKVEDKID